MKNLILLSVIIPLIFFSSCKSKSEKEMELLQAYITEHNITTEPTASGLYYIETLEGTGDYAATGNKVKVHYEGRLIDGEVFDSSFDRGKPSEFIVGQLIQGWNEGLTYMKIGGKATLIIPSKLAYGTKGSDNIPGYSTLIFDLELISII
ncbi:MAG: FKBP-type peptidyl-prolyl cis-trans isomerase [Bacteroidales bacterium]|nr:FKBP-type peptidyl-prolyl cis-trans isomerase [Bacteroidales bacterium]